MILANHATIDYLLLLHHHGCNEIAQMCYFNLSDESKFINGKLHDLQELTKQIHVSQGLNTGLWNFLTGWLPDINWLKQMFLYGVTVLICLTGMGCLRVSISSPCKTFIPKMPASNMVRKPTLQQEGGDVERPHQHIW